MHIRKKVSLWYPIGTAHLYAFDFILPNQLISCLGADSECFAHFLHSQDVLVLFQNRAVNITKAHFSLLRDKLIVISHPMITIGTSLFTAVSACPTQIVFIGSTEVICTGFAKTHNKAFLSGSNQADADLQRVI